MKYIDKSARRSGKTTRLAIIVNSAKNFMTHKNVVVFSGYISEDYPFNNANVLPDDLPAAMANIQAKVKGKNPIETLVVIDDCHPKLLAWLTSPAQSFNLLQYHYAISCNEGFAYFYFDADGKPIVEECEFNLNMVNTNPKFFVPHAENIIKAIHAKHIYHTRKEAIDACQDVLFGHIQGLRT